jgi:hypothetical protein
MSFESKRWKGYADQNLWPVPKTFLGMKEFMLMSFAVPKTQTLLRREKLAA